MRNVITHELLENSWVYIFDEYWFMGQDVGFMYIKANISLRITIYIYCQLIRNLKGHTQNRIILGLKQK